MPSPWRREGTFRTMAAYLPLPRASAPAILFRQRKLCKWYYPFASIGFPLAYVAFLLIQAIILKFDSSILIPSTTTPLIYPYFFVNLDTQGLGGVLMWVGILSVAFVAVGYLFFGLDRLGKKKELV